MSSYEKVAILAGIGSKASRITPLVKLAETLEEKGYPTLLVDGATRRAGSRALHVSTPSEQMGETLDFLGDTGIIVSQSMGALAALRCIEETHVKALAISPPLHNPYNVLTHSRIQGRLVHTSDRIAIKSSSFSDDPSRYAAIAMNDDYYSIIQEESKTFASRYSAASQEGNLHTVVGLKDWNTDLITQATETTPPLSHVHTVEQAPHSFFDQNPTTLDTWMGRIASWATALSEPK